MPFRNYSLTKGGQLVIPQIFSPDFTAGLAGWIIRKDGSAEFNDLTFRGTFLGTGIIINADGAFFYQGAPAFGNLALSVTANGGGTDEFGNGYPDGTTAFGPDGSGIELLPGAVPQLVMAPGGWTIVEQFPDLFAGISGAGTAAERYSWNLASGYTSSGSANYQASAFGSGAAADGSADGFVQLAIPDKTGHLWGVDIAPDGATYQMPVYATQPGLGTLRETWHAIPLDGGWTSVVDPEYRMLPDGNVQVRGQVSHAGVTALTNINSGSPVPSQYRPGATRVYRPPVAGDNAGTVAMTTGGVLQMRASGFSATQAFLDGTYSL